jgi:shikimate kinase
VNLVLIGLRGAGKTTVGRMAAARLGWRFVDLDDLTRARLGGGSVAAIWRLKGEKTFREAEVRALEGVLGEGGQVIALGGGTPTIPSACGMLGGPAFDGVVIYLRATPATLTARLAAGGVQDRPSLTGAGVLEEVPRIFERRDPLYRELAGLVIETDSLSTAELADRVAAAANT